MTKVISTFLWSQDFPLHYTDSPVDLHPDSESYVRDSEVLDTTKGPHPERHSVTPWVSNFTFVGHVPYLYTLRKKPSEDSFLAKEISMDSIIWRKYYVNMWNLLLCEYAEISMDSIM